MINIEKINGKKLALLLMGKKENGEDDWAVFTGIARWDGKSLLLDRGEKKNSFRVPTDTLNRIKPVEKKNKETFCDAEYFIPLTVGALPDDANLNEYIKTDLKWPE